MARKSIVTLRTVAAALAVGGASGAATQQAGLWNGHPHWALWTCIGLPATVAVGEQVRLIRAETRRGPLAQRQEAIDRALNDAVLQISDLTNYSKWGVGVSAWEVRRAGRNRPERLERFGRRRFTDRPTPSEITWTRGKGVIGTCWQEQDEVHRDLRAACTRYPNGSVTPEKFKSVRPDLKLGMTLEEFRMMIGKYGEVLAVPIKNRNGKFLGCVAVDVPIEYCVLPTAGTAQLERVQVKQVAAATAAILGRILEDG
ncbi:MAG: hypothetical protein JWP40_987 [Blastococcus sp.]|nr:hypothetical protein [Blastococcus sp.]